MLIDAAGFETPTARLGPPSIARLMRLGRRFPEQEQDRIDFVYYRSAKWRSVESQVIRDHAERFPPTMEPSSRRSKR
ncbi:MAG: hypothetical protein R3B96_02230 [Pirellulaceae bacterium]